MIDLNRLPSNGGSRLIKHSKNSRRKRNGIVASSELVTSVNNVFVNYKTPVKVVPTFGGAVLGLKGHVPLDEVRGWLKNFVVHLLERIEVVLDPQLLLRELLVDHEGQTRLEAVVGGRSSALARHVHP